jgi:hypothetical protein
MVDKTEKLTTMTPLRLFTFYSISGFTTFVIAATAFTNITVYRLAAFLSWPRLMGWAVLLYWVHPAKIPFYLFLFNLSRLTRLFFLQHNPFSSIHDDITGGGSWAFSI